jgi:RNA polymerase sigma-70 factor (ECF subfamily)
MTSIREMTAPGGGESPLSDDEVVERVLAGETALFEVLMRRYNQRVYRAARAILGNDLEAEDVMQDAYVRAYANLSQFEHRASFSTWLTRIAIHEALARVRRSGRQESLDADAEPPTGPAVPIVQHRDPERRLFDHEMRGFLEDAIGGLPRDYRTVFVLREVEGMSTAETAESLDVSEDVIKTRLHRARGLLRDALYERAGVSTPAAFQFEAPRCDRVVGAVMRRIAATTTR